MAIATYRGRVEINCRAETCIEDAARANVGVACLACDYSTQAVIDLDDNVIGYLKNEDVPAEKTAPAKRVTEKKKEE